MSTIAAVKELRERAWANGWRVVPVLNRSKAPIGQKWPEAAQQNPPECLRWDPVPHALNTGIACAALRPLDLDIDIPEIIRAVVDLAFNMLGVTIVRSRPDSCRVLLAYRAATGQPRKLSLVGASHSDTCGRRIEVLGAGLQFLAFGTHPDGADFQWRDGGPDTTPLDAVPAITEDQLAAFLEAAAPLIGAAPPSKSATPAQRRPRDAGGAAGAAGGEAPPVGLVRLIDELADYSTDDYDTWIRVGCAFYHETAGSDAGLAAWDEWSAKSEHYNAAGLAAKWPTFGRGSGGTVVTGATIIHLARQARMARAQLGTGDGTADRAKPAGANGATPPPAGPTAARGSDEPTATAEPEAPTTTTGRVGPTPGPAPGPTPPPPPPPPLEPPAGGGEGGDEGDDRGDGDDGEDVEGDGDDGDGASGGGDDTGEGGDGGDSGGDTGTSTDDADTTDKDTEDEEEQDDEEHAEEEDGPAPEWIVGPDEIDDADRPPINVAKGILHRLADAAEAAIIASRIPVFHRGVLVRPAMTELDAADGSKTHVATLHPLNVPDLMDLFCRTANWRHWTDKKGYVADDPPPMVARILLGRVGQWRVPQVRGILSTPTIRHDGSLLRKPGYDRRSRYFLALPPDLKVPTISPEPERSECLAALKLLEDLLAEFPFVDKASHSVGLSLLITAVIRAAMIVAPIHAASSPTPGTGKSFLYDTAAAIAYGARCPTVFAGKGIEELEKKLNGILLRGTGLLNLDNLNVPLEGDLLCQAAERPLLDLRKLGKSDMYITPNSALIGACGNNMTVHDDLNRRVVMAMMDAEMERPELRRFAGNPFATVMAARGKFIAAVLTVVLGYLADLRGVEVYPVASYDQWSRFVREPLVWLGRADPADTMETLYIADPVTNELLGVMTAWEAAIGLNKPITTSTIMQRIEKPPLPARKDYPDNDKWVAACNAVREAWSDFAATIHAAAAPHGGKATARDVGDWLGRHSKRITNGRRFVSKQGHASTKTWWLAAGK